MEAGVLTNSVFVYMCISGLWVYFGFKECVSDTDLCEVGTVIYVWSMFTEPGAIVSFSCFCVYAMKNLILGLID